MDTTEAIAGSTNATAATFNAISSIDDSKADGDGYYIKKFIGGTEFTDGTKYPDYICFIEAIESAGYTEFIGYTGSTGCAIFIYVHVAHAAGTGLSGRVGMGN